MNAINVILQIALLVMGLFLVVAVLFQHGKNHGLSGTIAGGAETFFGKEQGKKIDKILGKLTAIVGVLFIVLVIAVYVIQPDYATSAYSNTDAWKSWSSYSGIFGE